MSYSYCSDAFLEINEKSAYLLGLLYADGNMSDKGCVTLNLKRNDIELQNYLKDYLKTEKPIYFRNKTNSTSFSFQSKIISERLLNFGLIPRKSLILSFPTFIDSANIRHFIRGYFDGDGSVSLKNSVLTSKIRVHFVGTYDMLFNIQKILIKELNITTRKICQMTKDKNTFQLEITKRDDVYNFKNYIYNDTTIFLTRKKEIFMKDITKKNKGKTSSNYKNICFRSSTNSWRANFYLNGKRKEKSFKTEEEAFSFLMGLNLM